MIHRLALSLMTVLTNAKGDVEGVGGIVEGVERRCRGVDGLIFAKCLARTHRNL